jgi:hypothetical protein
MKIPVSAVLFTLLWNGCLFSQDSKENAMDGEWKTVSYTGRYFENNDTSASRALTDQEWKIINHDPEWYSNIRFFEFENSTFHMGQIDSTDSASSKVKSLNGDYRIYDTGLFLNFHEYPDGSVSSETYPVELKSDSISIFVCYVSFSDSSSSIYARFYGKCPPAIESVIPPKKSLEFAISIKKEIR